MPDLPAVMPAAPHFEPTWSRQRLRVPRGDRSLLAQPSLPDSVDAARANAVRLNDCSLSLQGRTLSRLREWTRQEAFRAAGEYTSALSGEPVAPPSDGVVLVGGHQPSLFHPGVWSKNFAIGEMAARTGGVALHLIIDNDTLSTTRLRVPIGDRESPATEAVAFDADRPTQPWEEAGVLDPALFASFAERVAGPVQSWGVRPLLLDMWPDAVAHSQEHASPQAPSLRDCLCAARHRLERRWGLNNLELPLSRLCALDPFLWFTGHVLAHLERFRRIHNDVLREYRRVNRVRSRTHPVPELAAADDWHEAPFWVWRAGQHQRGRLFARQRGREVQLSDGHETFAALPLHAEMDACCAVEVLRALPEQGIRLRTRALTTTLFARLCLADLFVHGIGGAKYDEMTDHIIARFYGIEPPRFQTLSATMRLPLAEPWDVTAADERQLTALERDLEFNSDRHLPHDADEDTRALAEEKHRLIAAQHAAEKMSVFGAGLPAPPDSRRQVSRTSRRPAVDPCGSVGRPATTPSARHGARRANYERFRRFQEINQQLAERAAGQRRRVEEELNSVRRQRAANAILEDREFSFCLYPEETLRPFMTSLWKRSTQGG